MLALPTRRLVREGTPVAAILLFWSVLSWFAPSPDLAAVVRDAGVVMSALYVIRRGVALSSAAVPAETDDLGTVLYENTSVAAPAAVWFLAAALMTLLAQVWSDVGLPGAFVSPEGTLVRACAGAGLGVVALYAVAVGVSTFRDGESSSVEASQADD